MLENNRDKIDNAKMATPFCLSSSLGFHGGFFRQEGFCSTYMDYNCHLTDKMETRASLWEDGDRC